MADPETHTHEAAAKLRIARVKALSNQDVVAVVTYLLAGYPDTFPAMLDDALSSVSPSKAAAIRTSRALGPPQRYLD
jgi:hypothetical protein